MKKTLILALATVILAAGVVPALTGQDILNRIRRTYDRINTFEATFDQTFVWKFAGTEEEMSGRFYMAKPNRFRVETEVQTVVTDGRTVWSWSPATKQVILNDYDPRTMPLRPDNFLFTFPDDESVTYVGESRMDGQKVHTVDVLPKDPALGIASMRVWVDDGTWLTRRVTYISVNDDTTTYVLRDTRMNAGVPSSVFQFDIPEDAEVVDFRESATR